LCKLRLWKPLKGVIGGLALVGKKCIGIALLSLEHHEKIIKIRDTTTKPD